MLGRVIFIVLLSLSPSLAGNCPWQQDGLEKWSDKGTWDDTPPTEGQSFIITKKILLDIETPSLGTIRIINGGQVVFSPSHDVKLTADNVIIGKNGSLLIGNPDCYYHHGKKVEIELTGVENGTDISMGQHTKGIYVEEGGILDIHGEEKLAWTKLAETLKPHEISNDGLYTLKLVDKPFGWKSGDKLVIASTDFDMYQAEEVEVVSCDPCDGYLHCTCTVRGEIRYTHYGEVYKDVDMRAEVGLLTRNIKIYGKMKDENDTYGGHIKAFEGFDTMRIRGAELTKMGQKGHKGRYPIHWHMCKTRDDPEKTYAMDNAIHHVFQRCITIHGTHGIHLVNNVAYHTFGHCYFLEDGGEKNNTLHHNLGLVTQAGPTIPSDRMPATFWITSPLNVLTENHAAGSDGMGIWYIFADNVTGPSADEGFFEQGEAFRTQIKTFESNTVHSNVDTGFMFGHELMADQDFNPGGGTDRCDPRKNPLDKDSEPAWNLIKGLTAYKNPKQNVWNDCRSTIFDRYRSSDTTLGLTLAKDCDILNSIFIGESGNLGEPNLVKLRNGSQMIWYRSTPSWHGGAYIGVHLYDGNPYVSGNTFADFYDDEYKVAGAIGFRKPHAGEMPTLFKANTFDFEDGVEGNYVKGFERFTFGGIGDSERMGQVLDWDGTITGRPLSTVVRDQPFYTSSWCESRPHWGMSVCPHRYVLGHHTGDGYGHLSMEEGVVVTRDDVPEYPEISNEHHDPWHPHMSTDHSYLYSFPNTSSPFPAQFLMILEGLDSGHSLLLGICTPLGATDEEVNFRGSPEPKGLNSYEDLVNDRTGAGYFWDKEVGAVFRRFQVDHVRDPELRERCVPNGRHCPWFKVETSEDEHRDRYCTDRAYPKYRKDPL